PQEPRRREPALVRTELDRAEGRILGVRERRRGDQRERRGQPEVRREVSDALATRPTGGDRDPPQQERHRGGRLDERPERQGGGRPQIATREDQRERGRDRQRDQQVVVPARRALEQHHGGEPDQRDRERRALGTDPADQARHDEHGREAR